MITFECQNCHKKLNAPQRKAGQRVACPNCKQPVQIPAVAIEAMAPPEPVLPDFEPPVGSYTTRRRRKKSGTMFVMLGLLFVGLVAVGGYVAMKLKNEQPRLALPTVNDAVLQELQPVTFMITAVKPVGWTGNVRYSLISAPAGAQIHPQNGQFSWTPTEAQGPGDYSLTIRAEAEDASAVPAEASFHFQVKEFNQPPVINTMETLSVEPGKTVEFQVVAHDPDVPPAVLSYQMTDGAPPGATFDTQTGQFRWTPSKEQTGQEFSIVFEASEPAGGLNALEIAHINVQGPISPSEGLLEELRTAGGQVRFKNFNSDLPVSGAGQVVFLNGKEIALFEFPDDTARTAEADKIRSLVKQTGEEDSASTQRFYQRDRLIVVYSGAEPEVLKLLETNLQAPFATGQLPLPSDTTEPEETVQEVLETDTSQTEFEDRLFRLHEFKLLLVPKRYQELRKIYAEHFATQQESAIAEAFGAKTAEMVVWLDEHQDIREELFTAIDPQTDNVVGALEIFGKLKAQFPEQIVPYANLAIAIAVTWDGNRRGVYDYANQQRRVHATMPDTLVGAAENFQYFLDNQKVMQGRAQFLPWEFQTHLVNHRTPITERQWAMQNYLPQRVDFGKCYADVPYDQEMLATKSQVCKLDGKEYTLENLKSFGGVCAQQADFAARVGKSLGVPAVYVTGDSNSGGLHAWVMWIEVKRLTDKSIDFQLLSYGRYRNDEYYVGQLYDPQSGQQITDRALEVKMHTIGNDPIAYRHASMVMRAYPLIRDRAKLDATQQLVFLRKVADLCPGHPEIWNTLASMSREGVIEKQHSRQMARNLDLFFNTFADYPDFIWTVFDDLLTYQQVAQVRGEQYARLVQTFENVGRPDLACEARLKLSEHQVANQQSGAAIEGLAYTIKKFPREGRYVPQLLDRLEEICQTVDGSGPQLVQFYQQFLPAVPTHRGNKPSEYCQAMYRRGVEFFKQQNQPQLAQEYQKRLEELKAGKSPS